MDPLYAIINGVGLMAFAAFGYLYNPWATEPWKWWAAFGCVLVLTALVGNGFEPICFVAGSVVLYPTFDPTWRKRA